MSYGVGCLRFNNRPVSQSALVLTLWAHRHVSHHRPSLFLFIYVLLANEKHCDGLFWGGGWAFCGVGGVSYLVGEVNNRLTEK